MTLTDVNISEFLQQAVNLHRNGEVQQAEVLYREILALNPDDLNANYLLGIIEVGRQQFEVAVPRLRHACNTLPDEPLYQYFLGIALRGIGDIEGAEPHLKNALNLNPTYADAAFALADLWQIQGQTDRAEGILQEVLTWDCLTPEILRRIGEWAMRTGLFHLAVQAYQSLTNNDPCDGEAFFNLGNAYFELQKFNDAVEAYRHSTELLPNVAGCFGNLGNTLNRLGDPLAACEAIGKAIELAPADPQLHINLAHALGDLAETELVVDVYEKALALDPDNSSAASNMLLMSNYSAAYSDDEVFSRHLSWGQRFEAKFKPGWNRTQTNVSGRRIRIGYLSGDFKRHSVAFFFEPVLDHHDRNLFEIFGYSMVREPDAVTARMQVKFDHWRHDDGPDAEAVTRMIREDRIDILVDLSGHSSLNRMPVMARKPAPVQVTWLGYPNTTGLTAIDYRLTDAIADPPGDADRYHTESLFRLPDGFLCYRGVADAPNPAPRPVLKRGYVTFGSFNSLNKINRETVADWAQLMKNFPESRMLLKCGHLEKAINRERLLGWFAEQGITPGRLDLHGMVPSLSDHLALYGEVDIALDPRPYNGTTTTFEALWMGVPVLTMIGTSHRSRVGASILTHLGLQDLIAENGQDLVNKAGALLERLPHLSKGLRERLRTSPMCDESGFTRRLEGAFQAMLKS